MFELSYGVFISSGTNAIFSEIHQLLKRFFGVFFMKMRLFLQIENV